MQHLIIPIEAAAVHPKGTLIEEGKQLNLHGLPHDKENFFWPRTMFLEV